MSYYRVGLQSVFITILMLVMTFAGPDVSARADFTSGREAPKLEPHANKISPLAGYCASSGGSTSYEYIQSVVVTPNSDGSTLTITVNVYIANPNGCTAGSPCPSYTNPEYVNVWIDWNGNGVFDASETVMAVPATGYLNINYSGTMTVVQQVTIPEAYADTIYMRANLGYGFNPSDPCLASWSWGNVLDQQITLPALQAPKITDLKIYPKFPRTVANVQYEPVIKKQPGYTLNSVSYTTDHLGDNAGTLDFDVSEDEANDFIYYFTPDAGDHGRTSVSAVLNYTKDDTGDEGKSEIKKQYNLFFHKNGNYDGTDTPNWYTYWKRDKAVPGIEDTIYEKCDGYGVSIGLTIVKICLEGSDQHYATATALMGPADDQHSFGGPTVWGIDTTAEVVAHEKKHQEFNKNWAAGGIWVGKADSDFKAKGSVLPTDLRDWNDKLPDEYETTVGSANNNVDTFDVAHKKNPAGVIAQYKYYGDNEYLAMLAGAGKKGVVANDWAYPGKQSNPTEVSILEMWGFSAAAAQSAKAVVETGASAGGGHTFSGKSALSKHYSSTSTPMLTASATTWFTGAYSEQTTDNNGNGLYDSLDITVGINVPESAYFGVIGWLEDSSGNEIGWAQFAGVLPAGVNNVMLHFSGNIIWESKKNGPYKISRIEIIDTEDEYLFDSVTFPYTTATAYNYNAFEHPALVFSPDPLTDAAVDTDSDGFFDVLEVSGKVTGIATANNKVLGWLYTNTGALVDSASASIVNGGYKLSFNGMKIRQAGVSGTFQVKNITLVEYVGKEFNQLDFIATPYVTKSYTAAQFKKGSAAITTITDAAVDTDSDGAKDKLNISIALDVQNKGNFLVSGFLYDGDIKLIDETSTQATLATGSQTVVLAYNGSKIYANGKNGPFYVKNIKVIDNDGVLADRKDSYTTAAYNYSDYQKPYVWISGDITIQTVANADGKTTDLTVLIPVTSQDGGNVLGEVKLVNGMGEQVAWGKGNVHLDDASKSGALVLTFLGTDILASGHKGPYYFTNTNIYNSADPAKNITGNLNVNTQYYPLSTFGAVVNHGVTYNGNTNTGGSVPTDGNAYADGATVTVLGNTGSLVRTGYTFAGWNTAANGSGAGYAGGAIFAMGSIDVTLYAKWTLIPKTHRGDLSGDDKVTISDALMALKIAVGLIPKDDKYLAEGDVAPYSEGAPHPDGKIDISDALVILRKCVGLINW